jgi:hypothetical protein
MASAQSASAFQTSNMSVSSTMSCGSTSSSISQPSPVQQRQTSGAPLPSPIANEHAPFFASLHPQASQQPAEQQLRESLIQAAQFQSHMERTGSSTTAQETSSYIKDYALVAEAAKRAQMAVLAREMESFELS